MKLLSLILSAGFLLISGNLFSANYFVNDASNAYDIYTTGTGNNSNPGTSNQPFATLGFVVNTVGLSIGDTVFVDAGYYFQTDANLLFNVDDVVIIGAGDSLTIFDNNQVSADANRWGLITGDNVVIQDLMVTGYNYGVGGASAIQIDGAVGVQIINVLSDENKPGGGASSIVVTNGAQVDFIGGGANCNTASSVAGGGVNVEGNGNTVLFNNYSFSNNSKSWQGGSGLYIAGDNTTNVTVLNSIFADNTNGSANGGAAIFISGSNLTIDSTCFLDNTHLFTGGPAYGGAISAGRGATVDITNCSFTGNSVSTSGKGGAISINTSFSGSGSATVISIDTCSFSGNTASSEGNDLYSRVGSGNSATFNVNECTFSGTVEDIREDNTSLINIQNSGNPTATGVGINFINTTLSNSTPITNCPVLVGSCYEILCTNSIPTGDANQSFCVSDTATIGDLVVAGGAVIVWYNLASGGLAYYPGDTLVDGQTYFAIDETIGCENSPAFAVTVQLDTGVPVSAGTNGALTICVGSTVTEAELFSALGASPDTGGTWSPVPAGAGVYTYTVPAGDPCASDSLATVTVSEQANANAGTNGALTICAGSIVTEPELFSSLGGSPDAGGTWSPVLAGAGVYTYSVLATSPCTSDSLATVTVSEQANANAGTNGTLTICAGSTVTEPELFSSLGGAPDAGGTWSPVLAGAGVYTYSVLATSPCTSDSLATVTVSEQANANAGMNGTLAICAGSTVTEPELFSSLGGSPDAGGTWSPVLAGAGVYTYSVLASSPCTSDSLATVTVSEQANANAGTNGTLTICAGSIVTEPELFSSLGGSPDAGGTWSPVLAGAGVYTYSVLATSPCTSDSLATVTVSEQANANAGTNGTLTICAGSTVTEPELFSSLGGSPDAGGTWSPVLAGAGVYTYSVLATNPCTSDSLATVSVIESDTLAPSGSLTQQFCFSNYSLVGDLVVAGNNVQWYSDAALTNPIISTDTLVDGLTYYATQLNNLGCESTSSLDVNVNLSNPSLDTTNINYAESSCGLSNGEITGVTVSGGVPNYNWSWINAGIEVSTNQDLLNQNSGIYSVFVTDQIGCVDSIEVLIINDQGAPVIDASAIVIDAETCDGSNGAIIGLSVTGGNGVLTYSWAGPNGYSSPLLNINNLESGNYTLTVTDENNCTSAAGPFIIQDLSGPSLNVSGLIVIDAQCGQSDGEILGAIVSGGNGNLSYAWTNSSGFMANTLDIQNLDPDNYTLIVSDTNNCADTINVEVLSDPVGTVEALDDSTFTNFETAVSLNIYMNDIGDVSSITVVTPPVNGSVSIDNFGNMTYTPDLGFSGVDSFVYQICDEQCNVLCEQALVTIIVNKPTDVNIPNGFSPNLDGFNDDFVIEGLEAYPNNSIVIFNRWGDLVFEASPYLNDWKGKTTNTKLQIIGDEVTDGTYYFILKLDSNDADADAINGFIDLRRN